MMMMDEPSEHVWQINRVFDKRVMQLLPKTFILLSKHIKFWTSHFEKQQQKKKAVRKVSYRLNTWKIAEQTISLLAV